MTSFLIGLGLGGFSVALIAILGTRLGASGGSCRLHRRIGLPDRCVGTCPGGGTCGAVRFKRYALIGRQAAECDCVIRT